MLVARPTTSKHTAAKKRPTKFGQTRRKAAAWRLGAIRLFSRSEIGRIRAGTALIPRGEFSIAIAGIGVAGAVEPELAPLAGAYVLMLAVTGPLIAKVIDPVVVSVQRRRLSRASA